MYACWDCINHILVSFGRTDSVSNPKVVKTGISQAFSDLYVQERNENINVSSKGKHI